MKITSILFMVAASLAAAADEPPIATVSVTVGQLGKRIPRDFDGFSIGIGSAQTYLGPASSPNLVFYQLLKNLGTGTIRLGSNSQDESCWDPEHAPRPQGCAHTITLDV
ncbi:MAG: hypothetical protein ABSC05_15935 [Candidatus Solibacter sp.]|jgi:hypothetical protein